MLSSQAPGPSEGLSEPLLHASLSGLRACGGTQALVPSVLWLMLSGALMTVTVHRTVPSHDPRSSDLRAYDTPYHKRKEDLGRHTAKVALPYSPPVTVPERVGTHDTRSPDLAVAGP